MSLVFFIWSILSQARDSDRGPQSLISRACGCSLSASQETADGPVQIRCFVGDAVGQLSRQFRVAASRQLLRASGDCSQRIAQPEGKFGRAFLMHSLIVPAALDVSLVAEPKCHAHEARTIAPHARCTN